MIISVIIPVYNVSDYIERCVLSVMNQTYQDLECIIVNDKTPDDSIEKCSSLINTYRGSISFKIINHSSNRGLSAARNTGTTEAIGSYIYHLDSDDEMTTDCIEKLVDAVKLYPEVQIVQGSAERVPQISHYDISFPNDIEYINDNNWIRSHYYCDGVKIPSTAWNKLIRTEFIRNHSLYFKEGLIHEDELWMYHVVKKLERCCFVKDITYIHYKTPNSIMSTATSQRFAHHWGAILNEVVETLDEPYYDNQLLFYLKYLVFFYCDTDDKKSYRATALKYSKKILKKKYIAIFILLLIYIMPLNIYHRGKWRLLKMIGKETQQKV